MTRGCLIIGAGGHARVVGDALLAKGETVLGYIDNAVELHGTSVYGRLVLGGDEVLDEALLADCVLVNGIGGVGDANSGLRRAVQERLEARGGRFVGVQHPSCIVSPFASLAPDAQLLAGSIVQPGARIAPGCIINTRAVVEHDCRLGAYVHCAPGSLLCGEVDIGENCHVGAGAVVRQGLTVGADSVVAAGAVVVRSHEGGGVLAGVPATALRGAGD